MHPTVNPVLPSSVPSLQTAIDSAVHSQSDIGWTNLFRGLISELWGDITNSTSSPTSREDRSLQTTNQLAGTIRALQDYSLNIWKSRNEFLHRNEGHGNAILMAQLHQEITTIYSIRDTFSPIIQSYFSKSLEDRLLCSRRQKQRWLRLVRLATAHATSKGSRQQVMSSYFAHTLTMHSVHPTMVTMPTGPLPPLIIDTTTSTDTTVSHRQRM